MSGAVWNGRATTEATASLALPAAWKNERQPFPMAFGSQGGRLPGTEVQRKFSKILAKSG